MADTFRWTSQTVGAYVVARLVEKLKKLVRDLEDETGEEIFQRLLCIERSAWCVVLEGGAATWPAPPKGNELPSAEVFAVTLGRTKFEQDYVPDGQPVTLRLSQTVCAAVVSGETTFTSEPNEDVDLLVRALISIQSEPASALNTLRPITVWGELYKNAPKNVEALTASQRKDNVSLQSFAFTAETLVYGHIGVFEFAIGQFKLKNKTAPPPQAPEAAADAHGSRLPSPVPADDKDANTGGDGPAAEASEIGLTVIPETPIAADPGAVVTSTEANAEVQQKEIADATSGLDQAYFDSSAFIAEFNKMYKPLLESYAGRSPEARELFDRVQDAAKPVVNALSTHPSSDDLTLPAITDLHTQYLHDVQTCRNLIKDFVQQYITGSGAPVSGVTANAPSFQMMSLTQKTSADALRVFESMLWGVRVRKPDATSPSAVEPDTAHGTELDEYVGPTSDDSEDALPADELSSSEAGYVGSTSDDAEGASDADEPSSSEAEVKS